jgi:FMN phosphatase YigB (HAD superfamily)
LIKNIIFDLGGVILDIDYNLTIKAFEQLGMKDAGHLYSKAEQNPLFDNLEKGLITENEFFDGMRKLSGLSLTNDQIRIAWNSLIIDLPVENVDLLNRLRKSYRIFLLSNTNSIHEKHYREMIIEKYGVFVFDNLFEKSYLSHHVHMRKPDPEIFEYVIVDANLKKEETLFIDDSPQHIQTATKLGIHSEHLNGEWVGEMLARIIKT